MVPYSYMYVLCSQLTRFIRLLTVDQRRYIVLTRSLAVAKRPCDCCVVSWDKYNWKTIFCGRYRSIFNHCDVIGLQKAIEFGEITQNKGYYAVQGHSRSPMSVPIESRSWHFFICITTYMVLLFAYLFKYFNNHFTTELPHMDILNIY